MSQTSDRLSRLLEDELGECCDKDLQQRRAELEGFGEETAGIEADSDLLGTLGNETRLRLVRYLDAADRELCVCELEALADVSESAVSHALSDLLAAGLVSREKRGKWRYYEATEEASTLLETLDEIRPGIQREHSGER